MAKFIVPFYDITNWKHNNKCETCSKIDKLISEITMLQFEYFSLTDNQFTSLKEQPQKVQDLFFKIQNKIITLECFQVDGYGVLQNFEAHGIVLNQDKIDSMYKMKNVEPGVNERINRYVYKSEDEYTTSDLDIETTFYSRWCKQCTVRKCDIYDTNRTERMDLIPITNAFAIAKDYKIKLNWEDSKAKSYSYTKVFKNGEYLFSATYNQYKVLSYIDRDMIPGKLYHYQIVNYDRYDEAISQKQLIALQERTVEEDNSVIPSAILDTEVKQRIILTHEGVQQHILHTKYTDVTDAEGTSLRLDISSVPYYEKDGEEISQQEELTKVLENGIPQDKYEIKGIPFVAGEVYYVKPYPYSEEFYRKIGRQYVPYRMYNRASSHAHVIYHKTVDTPTNLSIRNSDKKCFVKWKDTDDIKWKCTIIIMKLYDGQLISNEEDGEIIYTETERNLHVDNEYCIDNLISGKKYQIGIFSVSQEDIVTIAPFQLVGEPLYLRDEADFSGLSIFNGYSKMSYTVLNEFQFNEHDGYWWKYLKYFPIYGAKMYFSLQSEKITRIRIYIDDTLLGETVGPFWERTNFVVNIPAAEERYKICFWVTLDDKGFAYTGFHLYLRDLRILYNKYDYKMIANQEVIDLEEINHVIDITKKEDEDD